MIKRKLLGQHFLDSVDIAKLAVNHANISKTDTVFELGIGLGIMTPLLCKMAKHVISVDIDDHLVNEARAMFSGIENLSIKSGDGFACMDCFTVFVSNLPYSKSKRAIEFLAQATFSHGVIMVQKEFAQKLVARSKDRRAISVIATHTLDIEHICNVGKNHFTPRPKVDSVLLKITKRNTMSISLINAINEIFSHRRKTVKNILGKFNIESNITRRIDELPGDEIVQLGNKIRL